jgi:dUTP pyrophosphatase
MSDVKTLARIDALEYAVEELLKHPVVKFKRLHADAVIPKYQTAGAAGMDLVACCDTPITLWPGAEGVLVPTGLAMELPEGYEAQVRPRSGLSIKGIAVANSPGTIDEDYRGEVKVIMRNHGHTLVIHKGDRIAQLVIARAVQAQVVETDTLTDSVRGAGGFGSTGSK